ncbi:MAG TPA: alpha/beta hydrolase [Marinobacter sp.]|nr:alpha/beta hydrolase [Marinobacter sp.]
MDSTLQRNRVTVRGTGEHTLVFSHGFGCDQMVWDDIVPAFDTEFRVVTFDHLGCGLSLRRAYRPERHNSLRGYAADLLDVIDAVSDAPVTLIGHSVGGGIGMLASTLLPDRFRNIIAINPSARYLNDQGYVGGLQREEVEAMLAQMESDREGWAHALAPLVMENSHRPELTERLIRSFMATDPDLLRRFAAVTFLCDFRDQLEKISVPVDILYGLSDVVVPVQATNYMASRIKDVHCTALNAQGHYPQLSAPDEVNQAIQEALDRRLFD